MEKTMHAVVTHGIHDYRLEQVPVPQPGPGELLVQVEACGICAGDLKAFMGGERFWGGSEFTPYVEPPCIPGHEFIASSMVRLSSPINLESTHSAMS